MSNKQKVAPPTLANVSTANPHRAQEGELVPFRRPVEPSCGVEVTGHASVDDIERAKELSSEYGWDQLMLLSER
jgi:hypothetical protein